MAEITASMVKELRELTGLGMMECKKALEESGGDIKKAEELLRIKSGAKASKAASRVASEGAVGIHVSPDAKLGAMVEVNCETDFVARNPDFAAFAKALAELVANAAPADVAALSALGCLFDAKGENPEIALVFCRESARLAPDNALFRARLGALYRKMNRLEEALAEYERAAALGHDAAAELAELRGRLGQPGNNTPAP